MNFALLAKLFIPFTVVGAIAAWKGNSTYNAHKTMMVKFGDCIEAFYKNSNDSNSNWPTQCKKGDLRII